MRLTNKNNTGLYSFLSTLIFIMVIGGFAFFLIEKYMLDFMGWESILLIIIPIILLIIFIVRGRQIFEYDSDGEALNFKNRNVVPFLKKPASDEFPKYKLLNYEILNAVIFKKLYIKISSKKNHSIILKYDISYLTKKQCNDLKFSLNKVVKYNKENKKNNSQNNNQETID